jgi:glucose-6-phosphate 1-dehydrogenase
VNNESRSDALVFFGATGDLAHKMIFPALQALVKGGRLNLPVIGVAKAGWGLDQLRARARDSLEKFGGGLDPVAFAKLSELLRYVDGDYDDPTRTASLEAIGLPRATMGDALVLSAASEMSPRPRGRPRKRPASEPTLEMSMPGAE